MNQLGSLGGGNHFIELQRVEKILDPEGAKSLGIFKGQLTVMIHSGSRGFGHEIGGSYMKKAKQLNEKQGIREITGLSYFPLSEKSAKQYIGAMNAAANFAYVNRAVMAALVKGNISRMYHGIKTSLLYDVTHNMAKFETHGGQELLIHRKGSTRAFDKTRMKGTPFADTGQPVLIPGSMGTASYVLLGISSGEKSLFSVNHGAGRVMSRSKAAGGRGKKKNQKAAISDVDFKKSIKGVHLITGNWRAIKEEAPQAYKNIDIVIDTVTEAGLAKPIARLKPRAVLKG